jgi:drug/metabolite transporter (DMT)-like permease
VRIDGRTVALTLLALVAFASNSILTRLALGAGRIDAASFSAIRFASGAAALTMLVGRSQGSRSLRPTSAIAPLALVAYAAPFSFAYLRIGAAVGALILFGAAQVTMVVYGIVRGERPRPVAWVGLLMATAGLSALTLRSPARPDIVGLLLMTIAGIAWGVYSLAGKTAADPVAANARNFIWGALPLALLMTANLGAVVVTPRGVALALVSGVIATAGGYVVWYRALRGLTVTQAAVAQLSVPVLAALGAVLFLDESISRRLVLSAGTVLGGITLVLVARDTPG